MAFSEHLRKVMEDKGLSSRKLAKAWHPEDPEGYRRSVMRYLGGKHTPTAEIRDQLAEALGVEPRMLPLGENSQTDLMADLMAAIRRLESLEARLERAVAA